MKNNCWPCPSHPLLPSRSPPEKHQARDRGGQQKQHATLGPPRGASPARPARFSPGAAPLVPPPSSRQGQERGETETVPRKREKKRPPVPTLGEIGAWRPQRRERDWLLENVAEASFPSPRRNLGNESDGDSSSSSSSRRHASFGTPPPYLSSIKEAIFREKEASQRAKDGEEDGARPEKVSPLPAEQRAAALAASVARLSRARAALAAMPLVCDTPSRSRARALAEEAAREAEEDVRLLEGGRALCVVVSR